MLPTRTLYTFEGEGVRLALNFTTAALPEDLIVYSRPVTYVTWTAQAIDGKEHDLRVRLEASAEIAVNQPSQPVAASQEAVPGLAVVKIGSVEQPVLAEAGDDPRADWGFFYVAAPASEQPRYGPRRAAETNAPGPAAWVADYQLLPMSRGAREALKPGKNLLAVRCEQLGPGNIWLVDVMVEK